MNRIKKTFSFSFLFSLWLFWLIPMNIVGENVYSGVDSISEDPVQSNYSRNQFIYSTYMSTKYHPYFTENKFEYKILGSSSFNEVLLRDNSVYIHQDDQFLFFHELKHLPLSFSQCALFYNNCLFILEQTRGLESGTDMENLFIITKDESVSLFEGQSISFFQYFYNMEVLVALNERSLLYCRHCYSSKEIRKTVELVYSLHYSKKQNDILHLDNYLVSSFSDKENLSLWGSVFTQNRILKTLFMLSEQSILVFHLENKNINQRNFKLNRQLGKILFTKNVNNRSSGLFLYDLQTKTSEEIVPEELAIKSFSWKDNLTVLYNVSNKISNKQEYKIKE